LLGTGSGLSAYLAMSARADLDRELDGLQQRVPKAAARLIKWLRKPASRWVRFPLAILLVLGGFAGFLPILGFWMVPLGLAIIALDVPFLRAPLARLLAYINRKLA
jgi:hypothetical protein